MRILLLEPYYTGSHASWAKGYAQHSQHQIDILSLPGRFWKWRMYGSNSRYELATGDDRTRIGQITRIFTDFY